VLKIYRFFYQTPLPTSAKLRMGGGGDEKYTILVKKVNKTDHFGGLVLNNSIVKWILNK
jgi:hypothetical protein